MRDLASWVILLIVVAGVIGIGLIVIRQTGVTIPAFVTQILWVLFAVILGVLAIKFLIGIL